PGSARSADGDMVGCPSTVVEAGAMTGSALHLGVHIGLGTLGHAPAGEQLERFVRGGVGGGGVDDHREAGVRREAECLVVELEVADEFVAEGLCATAVGTDVVRGPTHAELLAAG